MESKPIQKVLIIGGGLGGAALAQALRKSGLTVTMFERDASGEGRQQGYVIGLNEHGTNALLQLDLPSVTSFLTTFDTRFRSFKLTDDKFEKLMQFPFGGNEKGALVDRWRLREMLLEGLQDSKGEEGKVTVVWGKKFVKYEESEKGVVAYFEDGSTAEGDVLIGADGARSRVREQRTPHIAYDELPVGNVGAFIEAPPRPKWAKLQDTMATCLIRAFGSEGVSLLAMPFNSPEDHKEYIVFSLTFPCHEPMPTGPELKQYLANKAAKVNPETVELVEATPLENLLPYRLMHTCRLVKDKPLGKTTRVTLMGDAAHAMTSHAGLGANTAFRDAIDLAAALTSPDWRSALAKYETVMIKRGYEAVKASLSNTNRMTASSGKMRNYMMWLMGKFIGGESKVTNASV